MRRSELAIRYPFTICSATDGSFPPAMRRLQEVLPEDVADVDAEQLLAAPPCVDEAAAAKILSGETVFGLPSMYARIATRPSLVLRHGTVQIQRTLHILRLI